MGRDVVTYIVKPRTTTSMSPSSVVDTVERTTTPGRGATGAATANPLPASMATVIITAYLTAFSFTLQSYKKSVNRRLYRPIKSASGINGVWRGVKFRVQLEESLFRG